MVQSLSSLQNPERVGNLLRSCSPRLTVLRLLTGARLQQSETQFILFSSICHARLALLPPRYCISARQMQISPSRDGKQELDLPVQSLTDRGLASPRLLVHMSVAIYLLFLSRIQCSTLMHPTINAGPMQLCYSRTALLFLGAPLARSTPPSPHLPARISPCRPDNLQ